MSSVGLNCPRCGEQTLHRRAITINAWPYVVLALLSCGLWLIVWLIQAWRASTSAWVCQRCGSQQDFNAHLAAGEARTARSGRGWIYAAAAAGVLFIGLPVAIWAIMTSGVALATVLHEREQAAKAERLLTTPDPDPARAAWLYDTFREALASCPAFAEVAFVAPRVWHIRCEAVAPSRPPVSYRVTFERVALSGWRVSSAEPDYSIYEPILFSDRPGERGELARWRQHHLWDAAQSLKRCEAGILIDPTDRVMLQPGVWRVRCNLGPAYRLTFNRRGALEDAALLP